MRRSSVLHRPILPYDGVAESAVTSNTIDLRDAVDWTLSWYTISGTTSAHTLQVSNSSVVIGFDAVPNQSFIDSSTFGTGGKGALVQPPTGIRYARILRDVSNASVNIEVEKLVG